MKLPRNRFMGFALLWLVACVYCLVFKEASNQSPPFPHFDKVAHFALFFVQTWLLARAFIEELHPIPVRGLLAFTLCYAVSSEVAQALFTHTRQADVFDGVADLLGAACALYLAYRAAPALKQKIRQRV